MICINLPPHWLPSHSPGKQASRRPGERLQRKTQLLHGESKQGVKGGIERKSRICMKKLHSMFFYEQQVIIGIIQGKNHQTMLRLKTAKWLIEN